MLWANPILPGKLKAILINFYAGNRPSVDVDNMSKPILDVLENIVYHSAGRAIDDFGKGRISEDAMADRVNQLDEISKAQDKVRRTPLNE